MEAETKGRCPSQSPGALQDVWGVRVGGQEAIKEAGKRKSEPVQDLRVQYGPRSHRLLRVRWESDPKMWQPAGGAGG